MNSFKVKQFGHLSKGEEGRRSNEVELYWLSKVFWGFWGEFEQWALGIYRSMEKTISALIVNSVPYQHKAPFENRNEKYMSEEGGNVCVISKIIPPLAPLPKKKRRKRWRNADNGAEKERRKRWRRNDDDGERKMKKTDTRQTSNLHNNLIHNLSLYSTRRSLPIFPYN